jgi:hypothetical protein
MALLILAPLAHTTPGTEITKTNLKPAANAYASAAGLPALDTHADFELRVWTRDYMGGSVFGNVVTDGQLRILHTGSTYEDGKIIVKPAQLGTPSSVTDLRGLENLVAQLETRNGTIVTCPALDGGSVLVHAVLHRRVITVQIDNPDTCTDAPSKAMVRLLVALHREAALHCNTGEQQTQGGPWITGFWRVQDDEDSDSPGEIMQFRPD